MTETPLHLNLDYVQGIVGFSSSTYRTIRTQVKMRGVTWYVAQTPDEVRQLCDEAEKENS